MTNNHAILPATNSKLYVKLCRQVSQIADQVSVDQQNNRISIRCERPTKSDSTSMTTTSKPKWWKGTSSKHSGEECWKEIEAESIFNPDVTNRTVSSECLPVLINAALEGSSTCLAISSNDNEAPNLALYNQTSGASMTATAADRPLLSTCISWLFDLIDTFRGARSSARFSVRVSASRMFINANNGQPKTADLLEHITQDGSSGDIPKLLNVGRLAGPREVRASSAKQAISFAEQAVTKAAASKQPSILVFTLNIYQYQIERQPNGSETISGGRGQFHFIDFGTRPESSESPFCAMQSKVVSALSNNLPSANMPTAFASLTGQLLRDFQRCRMCHMLSILSSQDAAAKRSLELFEVFLSQLPVKSSSSKRRSTSETSQSYDSATLPRLSSLTSFHDECQMTSSISGRLSHCVSGSELSLHTVIHRPSPLPPPLNMQTSFTSNSNGCPPSLASTALLSRPSYYSDSETESVSRLRQPSLAPMQPLETRQASENENDAEEVNSPMKSRNEKSRNHQKARYARLKRFASSRMKRQMEQHHHQKQKLANARPTGGEIWIDGPGAMTQSNKLQQVENWIDGPMSAGRNNVAANAALHQQLCHQLNLESHHCSLPRPAKTMGLQPQTAAVLRSRHRAALKNGQRPPSISCSSENLFVDSGFYADTTSRYSKSKPPGLTRPIEALQPQYTRPAMSHLVDNVDYFQRRFHSSFGGSHVHYAVSTPGQQVPIDHPKPVINFVEAKKVAQSPFMRLKNKILGKKQIGTTTPSCSVPSSPVVLAKRQFTPQQPQVVPSSRVSRITDTSDSGNDCGSALYVGAVEDALSTTKSLSCSSTASPPSPGSAAPSSSANSGSTKPPSSSSVCSHSSGRGSSSSLLSHSVGGSQPSIADSADHFAKGHPNMWTANALSAVEEELVSAVSALQQTVVGSQCSKRQCPSSQKVPCSLAVQESRSTPRSQRRQVMLDVSEVSESPSCDELLCLESLEQQLLS